MSTWDSIVGHDWAVELLSGAIAHDRVGHAYLITGPDRIGKMTLARTFAQALNCEAEEAASRPCGQCRACRLIAGDHHPDMRIVEPEVSSRGKASIKIDQMRDLQQALSLSAYEARTKVAIIRRFDTANINAANAFLKTLEEPPANVVLILTATDADTLLETIKSRCRTIALRPVPTAEIETSLQARWHISAEDAHLLSHLADGRLGWAVSATQTPDLRAERDAHIEALNQALSQRRVGRFQLADKLARKPETLPDLLKTWLSWWRDALLLAHNENVTLTNIDQLDQLRQTASAHSDDRLLASLKQTDLALWQLDHNANTRLVLENLLLVYPI